MKGVLGREGALDKSELVRLRRIRRTSKLAVDEALKEMVRKKIYEIKSIIWWRIATVFIANGTVGYPLLEGIDYISVFREEPSLLETAYAIFANNIEMDEDGKVLNAKYAEQRVAQYIWKYCDPTYKPNPGFDGTGEVELY